jgi:predicted nucleic acid-binding protein
VPAAYFFDTSALVKSYATETGTAWVTALLDPANRNRIFMAQITGAELIAALKRKQRGQHITATDFATAATQFRLDFTGRFRTIEISSGLITEAMTLAERYALRGYDAVQLAAALSANSRRIARGLAPLILITADLELLSAGAAEGLTTDDPNTH